MRAGKVVAAVIGSIFALAAIGLLIGGGLLFWAYETQRDEDGFFNTPDLWLASDGYALVSASSDLVSHPGDWWPTDPEITLRLRARSAGGEAIFIGIAPTDAVRDYILRDVAHSEVRDVAATFQDFDTAEVIDRQGGAPASPPEQQEIWVASAQGTDEQSIEWSPKRGEWTAVIMNADGAAPVSVSVATGARVPVLRPISLGMIGGGILMVAFASLLLVGATRRVGEQVAEEPARQALGPYPVRLEGTLDPQLSPALWLVKWFLIIPHLIVLAFLWAAFAVLSFFAWLSILFTGRYPRGIFDFNVGVLRWTWRVSFYSYSVLGTDRYPPFTLQDIEYPASFSIHYPDRLSPGLALVKWWLLALPHYLIIGILGGGAVFWVRETGVGLIPLLALIAGGALLFTARYPRSLFEFLLGLNRWVFRVWAYAMLMTDEYPPFRLDMGANEPQAGEE